MTELKKRLEAAGLNQLAIAAALGPVPNREAVEAHLRRRVDTSLVELFVLGEPVAAGKLPVPAEELEAAGLVVRDGELVRAPLRLTPHEGLLLAHDGEELVRRTDYVTGVNNATRTLATHESGRQPHA